MNSKKRVMSWILAVLMIFSLVPVSISAADDCNHEDYDIVSILKPADCGNGIRGIRKLECNSCGYVWYEQYDGHNMEQTIIDATCTEPARVGEKCSICGAVGETTEVEGSKPLGHDIQLDTANEEYVAATCDEGGLDTFTCSRCDYTETQETEALEHAWIDIEAVDADCVNAAGVKQICDNCGETRVVSFEGELAESAKGHNPEAVEYVAPTCSTTGLTGKTICSVCGEILDEGTEVPVDENAHVPVLSSTLREATCTTTGIGKYTCEYCGANLGYKTITVEHDWSDDLVNDDATAIYRICLNCGEIQIVETFEGYDHKYEAVVTAPTCTEAGCTTYTCACGYTYTADEVEALGHDYTYTVVNGKLVKVCTRCNNAA